MHAGAKMYGLQRKLNLKETETDHWQLLLCKRNGEATSSSSKRSNRKRRLRSPSVGQPILEETVIDSNVLGPTKKRWTDDDGEIDR